MFISIPDINLIPKLVNINHIVSVEIIDPETTTIYLSDSHSFNTTLPREILVNMIDRKTKERIPVQTQQSIVV